MHGNAKKTKCKLMGVEISDLIGEIRKIPHSPQHTETSRNFL